MKINIDGLTFDRAHYDADGDVLYLARGESSEAAEAALTPEGHGVRYGADGQVMGVTMMNARWLLERDGHLTITLPHAVRVEARDLAGALPQHAAGRPVGAGYVVVKRNGSIQGR
jgi:uncharacterized protein YuzE